jgi:serine/threonine protein kinase
MFASGTVFAERYEILRCISAGGMGTIYEVLHRETRRRRALKVMLPNMLKDADLRRRFTLEAQVTADVDSEHLVETFDAGIDPATGSPFLVMELLRGEDLGVRLGRLTRLSPAEVVGLLGQAASALDKTHAAGIVHRDLKPENLFISQREGGTLRLKLLDFGIAKVFRETEAGRATRSMGTPIYMAPEQFEGDPTIGPAADLYALGQIAFTLLVGEGYWADLARRLDNSLALMARVSRGANEAASVRAERLGVTLPEGFDLWFSRATHREAGGRYPSARAQMEALAAALGEPDALDAPVKGSVPESASASPPGTPTPRTGDSKDGARHRSAPTAAETPLRTPQLELADADTEANPSEPDSPLENGARTIVRTEPPRRFPMVAVGLGLAAVATIAIIAIRGGGSPPDPALTASGPATTGSAPPTSTPPPPTAAPPSVVPAVEPPPVTSASATVSALPSSAQPRTGPVAPPRPPPSRPPPPPSKGGGTTAPPAPEPWRTR